MRAVAKVFDAFAATIATRLATALVQRLEPMVVAIVEQNLATRAVAVNDALGPTTEPASEPPRFDRRACPETLRSSGVESLDPRDARWRRERAAEQGVWRPLEGRR